MVIAGADAEENAPVEATQTRSNTASSKPSARSTRANAATSPLIAASGWDPSESPRTVSALSARRTRPPLTVVKKLASGVPKCGVFIVVMLASRSRQARAPGGAASAAIFSLLYGISARYDSRYPCSAPNTSEDAEEMLGRVFARTPGVRENDGVVPLRSQLWGKLVWVGYGDHLDVLGHFRDDKRAATSPGDDGGPPHVDWLFSASGFDRARFGSLVDAITPGLVSSGCAVPVSRATGPSL